MPNSWLHAKPDRSIRQLCLLQNTPYCSGNRIAGQTPELSGAHFPLKAEIESTCLDVTLGESFLDGMIMQLLTVRPADEPVWVESV
jgi:hypothetical protein